MNAVNSTTAEFEVEHLARVNQWTETEVQHADRRWRLWHRDDVMLRVRFTGSGGIGDAFVSDEAGDRRIRFPQRQAIVRLLTVRQGGGR